MSTRRNNLSPREAAIEIVRELRSAGFEAYFAGGCVRDELLGLVPTDYDVATNATPEKIGGLFRRTAAVGAAFGVMLVRDFEHTIEVATFRTDGTYTDQRRPDSVVFTTAEHDAERRDFTINAMFLDPLAPDNEQLIDYVGGRGDLSDRILRAVGNPEDRLREDHLRALRAIRFAARFGLAIDPATSNAIRAHASDLRGVSVERIGEEIKKMMRHPSRALAVGLLREHALEETIFGTRPRNNDLSTLRALSADADAIVAIAAWRLDFDGQHDAKKNPPPNRDTRWTSALNFSRNESEMFVQSTRIASEYTNRWDGLDTAARKRLASLRHARGALLLAEAINPEGWVSPRVDIERLDTDGIGLDPDPLISGRSLMDLGADPGPHFQSILDSVYDAQLDGRITDTDSAINMAKTLLESHA